MPAHGFLSSLTLVLGAATLTGVVSHRLKQPAVLGYLLAGLLIGPHAGLLPFHTDEQAVHTLASLGVILIMFSLGLEFSVSRLLRLATRVGTVAAIEVSLMASAGYLVGRALGLEAAVAAFLGAMVSISSTMVIYKTFGARDVKRETTEQVYGILIFEDVAAILIIALLSVVGGGGALSASGLLLDAGALLLFMAVLVVLGRLTIPRAMRYLVRTQSPEMVLLASLAVCFGLALLVRSLGYSEALGAFLAGGLAAESGRGNTLRARVQPITDLFGAVFFVSIGMLVDPALLLEHAGAILALSALVVAGKLFSVSVGMVLAGYGTQTAMRAAACLTQIGEFSFLIAVSAASLGETAAPLYPIAAGVCVLTTLLTPLMVDHSDQLARRADELLPQRVRMVAGLWGTWLQQLRTTPGAIQESARTSSLRRLGLLAYADAAIIVLIVAATSINFERGRGWLSATTGAAPELVGGAFLVLVGLACVPFLVGIWRCARRGGTVLAERLLPHVPENALDLAAAPRATLELGLELTLLMLVVAPLLAVAQPFLPPLPGFLLLLLLAGLVTWLVWRQASDLQGHAKAGSQVLLEVLARQAHAEEPDLSLAARFLPGLGQLSGIKLDEHHAAVGRSLAEIDLRGHDAAGVLFISRDGKVLLPDAKEVLRAGDVLVVGGAEGAGERAQAVLAGSPED